jgi:nucleoside-diphosphate-sugar epimerase
MSLLLTGAAGRIGTILRTAWARTFIVGTDIVEYEALKPDCERKVIVPVESPDLERAFTLARTWPSESEGDLKVVHLAAAASDAHGWDAIERSNIRGAENVFRLAQKYGATKVVFASTNHVTGGYDVDPSEDPMLFRMNPEQITPDMPVRPDGLYGASKAFGEAVAAYYAWRFSLSVICLRIGAVTDRNDPLEFERLRAIWLSHVNACELFDRALAADVRFGIYYGISANTRRSWDISNAERELGYHPLHNAEDWYTHR